MNLAFQIINQKNSRHDFSASVAGGAFFSSFNNFFRANTLPCNLHEAKFTKRQDVMLCTVIGHNFLHMFIYFWRFACMHINKIDNDYAAHIPQPELTGNFITGSKIDFKGIRLLVPCCFSTVSTVNINYMKSFSMFYNKVGSIFKGNCFSK
jgi:hypothetical protein